MERAQNGPKLTRQERKERTRALLIEAGVKLIVERGLFGSSLETIAAEAGLTKGAIYSNFGSKAEFFFELAARLFGGPPISSADSAEPERLARDFLGHLRAHPEYWARMLEFVAYTFEDPELRQVQVRNRFPDGVSPLTGPEDARWREVAREAAVAGIAAMRLVYGDEFVPDELGVWMFQRLAASDLRRQGVSTPTTTRAGGN